MKTMQPNPSSEFETNETKNKVIHQESTNHKTFEDRLAAYNGQISVCKYDWGIPKGKEIL